MNIHFRLIDMNEISGIMRQKQVQVYIWKILLVVPAVPILHVLFLIMMKYIGLRHQAIAIIVEDNENVNI